MGDPEAMLHRGNSYGFTFKLAAQDEQDRERCYQRLLGREPKWETYANRKTLPSGKKLKRYLRKGVPPKHRRWVWMKVSGASEARVEGHFEEMIEQGSNSVFRNQIELDLPRTFPGENRWLASPEGQESLRRVLVAYSAHNPKVGYCQSMNYVAAVLLLVLEMSEEDTFWLMVVLLDGLLYPGMYANNLEGCHVEMQSLGQLLAKKDPVLSAHMDKLGCEMNLVATDWFLCLFCTTLPVETAVRVWDAMLYEGPKVLYRVALALLRVAQGFLLETDNPGDFLVTMRRIVASCYDQDTLMKIAFDEISNMPMGRIDKYRKEKQQVVDEDMRRREALSRKKSLRRTIEEAKAGVQQREAGGSGRSGGGSGRANNGSRHEGSSSDHPVGSVRGRSNGARAG